MAICCGGKKQKVSHPVTSSLNHRHSSDKHNGHSDHHLKVNSSIRHRSHSHFNHQTNHLPMPHDLSRSTANSASSSALTYAYGSPAFKSNNFHQKSVPMDVDDDDDDDDDDHRSTKEKKTKQLNHKSPSTVDQSSKHLIVHVDMIFYCFEILGNYLFNGKHHLGKSHLLPPSINGQLNPSPLQPPTLPTDPYPLFVTWLIGSEQKLRGCIGTFTPMNLAQG